MNVDRVRRLDHYIGVPLCFLGTLLKKAVGLLLPGRRARGPKNVLFIELSEMGSTILADPAMQKAKLRLNANLHFAIFRKNSPSLELLDTVPRENVFLMEDSGVFAVALGALKFLAWTRRKGIDTVIELELFSRFTALLAGFSGAERTVGFHAFTNEGLYRGDFLTHKVAYNPHQHIAKNFIALVNALLRERPEVPFSKTVVSDDELLLRKVAVSETDKQGMCGRINSLLPAFDARRDRIVLFNTNTSDLIPVRRWPQEYYGELAVMILREYPRVIILLTGDPSERRGKEDILGMVRSERCINFAGQTALKDLPALYAVSACMLTNDSGPAHFAAVTDMPVFAFFGPETPKLYSPLGTVTPIYAGLACSPCVTAENHRKTVCTDNVCLQVITPDQVFRILRPTLDALR